MDHEAEIKGHPLAGPVYEAARQAALACGEIEIRASKSQVAFRRRKAFAWAWMPGKYLRGRVAPLVLSLSLDARDTSPRWKEIVEPAAGRFMHHLELHSPAEVDEEVRGWLRKAWEQAG